MNEIITQPSQHQQREEDSLDFHDRCKEIRLMLNDCLIYPEHLQYDKVFLRKVKLLNYALACFEDVCKNMISTIDNNTNK